MTSVIFFIIIVAKTCNMPFMKLGWGNMPNMEISLKIRVRFSSFGWLVT